MIILFHLSDKDHSGEDSVEDDMQVSQWSSSDVTVNRSIMFMSSQQDDHLNRTPVRRHNRSASRKNLSRSFSQILNEEFNDDEEEKENLPSQEQRMLPLIHAELLDTSRSTTATGTSAADEEDDEVFVGGRLVQDKRRLFVRTRSAHGRSESIYRTDSGFTDDDLTSSSAPQPSFSTPSVKDSPVMGDVSMRSLRCD